MLPIIALHFSKTRSSAFLGALPSFPCSLPSLILSKRDYQRSTVVPSAGGWIGGSGSPQPHRQQNPQQPLAFNTWQVSSSLFHQGPKAKGRKLAQKQKHLLPGKIKGREKASIRWPTVQGWAASLPLILRSTEGVPDTSPTPRAAPPSNLG